MIPIVDLHTDLELPYFDIGPLRRKLSRQINLNLLESSGVRILLGGFGYDGNFGDPQKQLETYKKLLREGSIRLVLGCRDLDGLKNGLGLILHIEGGGFIKSEKEFLRFYSQGVRSISLTHNYKNKLACGVVDNDGTSLTSLGRRIVKLANKLGVIVDLAHLNDAGFKEVIKLSSKPVVVSHTCCREICSNSRNISDGQIREIAKKKGVIGVFFSKRFVSDSRRVGVKDVVKHFLHIAELVGPEYLAIGSDFGGITTGTPVGLSGVDGFQELLAALREAGFSEREVENIAYKNATRVLKNILI